MGEIIKSCGGGISSPQNQKKLKLDTKTGCFLCLQVLNFKEEVKLFNDCGDGKALSTEERPTSASLKNLFHHLNIDTSQLPASSYLKTDGDGVIDIEIEVDLCHSCAKIVNKLSSLCQSLEKIDSEVIFYLEKIQEVISEAALIKPEPVHNYLNYFPEEEQRPNGDTGEEKSDNDAFSFLDYIRKRISVKCSKDTKTLEGDDKETVSTGCNWILQRKLDTGGCCFMCKKLVILKTEEDDDKESEANNKKSVSLKTLCRYLKINANSFPAKTLASENNSNIGEDEPALAPLPLSFNKEGVGADIKTDLCGSCAEVFNKFSIAFLALERIHIEMNYWLGRIHQKISEALIKNPELMQNQIQRMKSDPETLAKLMFVDELRKEISTKCSKVRNTLEAKVELFRVEVPKNATAFRMVNNSSRQSSIKMKRPLPFHPPTPSSQSENEEEEEDSEYLPTSEEEEEFDEEEFEEEIATVKTEEFSSNSDDGDESPSSSSPLPSSSTAPPQSIQIPPSKMFIKTETGSFKCASCPKIFKTVEDTQSHFKSIHIQAAPFLKCENCAFPYTTLHCLNLHKKTCTVKPRNVKICLSNPNPGSYVCFKCNKEFLTQSAGWNHYQIAHTDKKFECNICHLSVFHGKHSLKFHKSKCQKTLHHRLALEKARESDPEFNYPCAICCKRFRKGTSLLKHQSQVHSFQQRFSCDLCKKIFKEKKHLNEHKEKVHSKSSSGDNEHQAPVLPTSKMFVQNPKTGLFDCSACDRQFKGTYNARIHYEAVHIRKRYPCDLCGATYSHPTTLRNHKANCNGTLPKPGAKKSVSDSEEKSANPEAESKSSARLFKCEICNISEFKHSSNLTAHQKTCKETLAERLAKIKERETDPKYKFSCPTCEKRYTTQTTLRRHQENVHEKKGPKHKCEICEKNFTSLASKKEHKESVHFGRKLFCRFCDRQYQSKQKCRVQEGKCTKKQTPKENPTSASESEPEVNKEDEEMVKVKTEEHSDDAAEKTKNESLPFSKICVKNPETGSYDCSICHKSYKKSSAVRPHYDVTHLQKRYRCEYCGAVFTLQDSLTKHRKRGRGCTKEKPKQLEFLTFNSTTGKYNCRFCKKEFKEYSNGVNHYKVLHLKKRYECDCGIGFLDFESLNQHKRNCEEQKAPAKEAKQPLPETTAVKPGQPCTCPICGKTVSNANVLKQHHEIVHLKKKKYSCDICKKRFFCTANLRLHKDSVHLGKRFYCRFCNQEYKYLKSCTEHESKCSKKSEEEVEPELALSPLQSISEDELDREEDASSENRESTSSRTAAPSKEENKEEVEPSKTEDDSVDKVDDDGSESCLSLSPKAPYKEEVKEEEQEFTFKVEVPSDSDMEDAEADVPSADSAASRPTVAPVSDKHLVSQHAKNIPPYKMWNKNPETGKFACSFCQREFTFAQVAIRHYKSIHLGKRWTCNLCKKSFTGKHSFKIHKCLHRKKIEDLSTTSSSSFPTEPVCSTSTPKVKEDGLISVSQMYSKDSKSGTFSCSSCKKPFQTIRRVRCHYQSVHLRNRNICDHLRCGLAFETVEALKSHQENSCLRPPITGNRKGKYHEFIAKTGKYKCIACDRVFSTATGNASHFQATHQNRKHLCDICGSIFSHGSKFNLHKQMCREKLRINLEKRKEREDFKFVCSTCGNRFAKFCDLSAHKRRVHRRPNETDGRRFHCDLCDDKTYKTRTNLNVHKKVFHKGIRLKCKRCGKEYTTGHALRFHEGKCEGQQQQ